jgi:CBS-domain-containing membrane protein
MIARHFRPQEGDCFVDRHGRHLCIEKAEEDHVTTKNGTWSRHAHRKMTTHAMKTGPVWFYPREGGAVIL